MVSLICMCSLHTYKLVFLSTNGNKTNVLTFVAAAYSNEFNKPMNYRSYIYLSKRVETSF